MNAFCKKTPYRVCPYCGAHLDAGKPAIAGGRNSRTNPQPSGRQRRLPGVIAREKKAQEKADRPRNPANRVQS